MSNTFFGSTPIDSLLFGNTSINSFIIPEVQLPFSASGGDETEINGFRFHYYDSGSGGDTGTGSFTVHSTGSNVKPYILLVGGGGGGKGGGGGAGGVIYDQFTLNTGTTEVIIGDGGTGGTAAVDNHTSGSVSTFGNGILVIPGVVSPALAALGGGAGGLDNQDATGSKNNGGSGGGAGTGYSGVPNFNYGGIGLQPSGSYPPGGYGTPGSGSNGGNATFNTGSPFAAAGGGGASEIGASFTYTGSATGSGGGGDGIFIAEISTSLGYGVPAGYFGGGGGGRRSDDLTSFPAPGGLGGGGTGNTFGDNAQNGFQHTGGGGGGAAAGGNPGDGGSGLCIIWYPTSA